MRTSERPITAIETPEQLRLSAGSAIWMLLLGTFAPPLLALLNVDVNQELAPWACATGHGVVLQVASLLIVCAVLVTGVVSSRCLARIWSARAVRSRLGVMAIAGVFESAAFAVTILVTWLPSEYLLACRR
jgi:hypothetical protein